jgi:hypothetical protein
MLKLKPNKYYMSSDGHTVVGPLEETWDRTNLFYTGYRNSACRFRGYWKQDGTISCHFHNLHAISEIPTHDLIHECTADGKAIDDGERYSWAFLFSFPWPEENTSHTYYLHNVTREEAIAWVRKNSECAEQTWTKVTMAKIEGKGVRVNNTPSMNWIE